MRAFSTHLTTHRPRARPAGMEVQSQEPQGVPNLFRLPIHVVLVAVLVAEIKCLTEVTQEGVGVTLAHTEYLPSKLG